MYGSCQLNICGVLAKGYAVSCLIYIMGNAYCTLNPTSVILLLLPSVFLVTGTVRGPAIPCLDVLPVGCLYRALWEAAYFRCAPTYTTLQEVAAHVRCMVMARPS